MSSRGYNETLTVPSNHKDSSGSSLKAFDGHFRTLNNGLLSVARNLSGMNVKVGELETATKSANDLKHRVDTMEKTLASHGKVLADIRGMIADMARGQQAPPNTTPQAPAQFADHVRQENTKTRAQLMAEAQRAQIAQRTALAQKTATPPVQTPATPPVQTPAVQQVKENINDLVEDMLKQTTATTDDTTPKNSDQPAVSKESESDDDQPGTEVNSEKSESGEDEHPDTKVSSKKDESSGESSDEVEISESDEDEVKPVAKPVPKPAVKPVVKPVAKPVAKRIVTQKKK